MMADDIKWYRYDMINYMDFFRAVTPLKDKPYTIYHIHKFDVFEYLGNKYKFILDLDDDPDFFKDNALFHLNKKTYPSTTVDFLGSNGYVETYFLRNDELQCYEFKLKDNKKIQVD